DAEPKARIARAVDEADQQLPEQSLRTDAEHFEHFDRSAGRPDPKAGSALHQRATALGQGPKRLVPGDRRAQLVVIPRRLRLGGLLHLEQIHWVNLSAAGALPALAQQAVRR